MPQLGQTESIEGYFFNKLEDLRELQWCHALQATHNLREGDLPSSITLFENAVRFSWGKYVDVVGACLESLGDYSCWGDSHSWKTDFLMHSLQSKENLRIQKALQFFGDFFLDAGDDNTATSPFTVVLDVFIHMDVHRNGVEWMLCLGDISKGQGDVPKAVELWGGSETAVPILITGAAGSTP
ncbi:hypothetical protein DFH08DRAFT_822510 [Mycena albidolilacea]|uniref:Uncharacterized protein n=1 Tax=Mycena albidolilacea TaxID=1033008 RepID=A0AAD6Z968_9AGAR|nr:hypothetical protein DFH08DRAFT_822510 [Mycena albidolilacea]